jgi:hypothetical protein
MQAPKMTKQEEFDKAIATLSKRIDMLFNDDKAQSGACQKKLDDLAKEYQHAKNIKNTHKLYELQAVLHYYNDDNEKALEFADYAERFYGKSYDALDTLRELINKSKKEPFDESKWRKPLTILLCGTLYMPTVFVAYLLAIFIVSLGAKSEASAYALGRIIFFVIYIILLVIFSSKYSKKVHGYVADKPDSDLDGFKMGLTLGLVSNVAIVIGAFQWWSTNKWLCDYVEKNKQNKKLVGKIERLKKDHNRGRLAALAILFFGPFASIPYFVSANRGAKGKERTDG